MKFSDAVFLDILKVKMKINRENRRSKAGTTYTENMHSKEIHLTHIIA